MNRVPAVPAAEWEVWVSENEGVILDVREPFEWAMGTLPGSVLMSMGEILDRIDELPRDRAILCVCRSGNRSHHIAAYLNRAGFGRAANLIGGLKAIGMQD